MKFVRLLNADLENEWKHLSFYTRATAMVGGFHRNHLAEFFKKQAQGELEHVLAFSQRVVSLGGVPVSGKQASDVSTGDPLALLKQAIDLEQEVVQNYTRRLTWLGSKLGKICSLQEDMANADAVAAQIQYLILFYEEQVEDSHADLDNLKEMIRGMPSYSM